VRRIDRPTSSLSADARLAGWTVSLVLHGTLAFGAFLFVQQITMAPQQTPFQWDVAMVEPTTQTTTSPAPTAKPSSPAPIAESAIKPTTTPSVVQPSEPTTMEPPPIKQTRTAEPPPAQPVTEQIPPPVAEHSQLTKTVETIDHPVTQAESITPLPPPTPTAPSQPASAPVVPPPASRSDAEPSDPVHQTAELHTPSQPTSSAPVEPAPAAQDKADTAIKDESPPQQVAALAPSDQIKPAKADYGWLTDLMAKWSNDLDKPYPTMLRTEGIQGKVTVSALLHDDGVLSHVRIAKSSGNSLLDQAAVEAVKNGPPLTLPRPLERPSILVKIPIVYILSNVR